MERRLTAECVSTLPDLDEAKLSQLRPVVRVVQPRRHEALDALDRSFKVVPHGPCPLALSASQSSLRLVSPLSGLRSLIKLLLSRRSSRLVSPLSALMSLIEL